MRPVKRKFNDLANNQINFKKIKKLNHDEYEEISYKTCLADDLLADITDNMKNLNIRRNITKMYNNVENPENIKVELRTKIKRQVCTVPELKTDNRFNFKKAFQQEIQYKSPQSKKC